MVDDVQTPAAARVPPAASPSWSRPGRYLGAAVLLLMILGAIFYIRPIASTLVLALVLVILMHGAARLLARFLHVPYVPAMIACYLVLLILSVTGFLTLVPLLLRWTKELVQAILPPLDSLLATLPRPANPDQSLANLAADLGPGGLLTIAHSIGDGIRGLVRTMLGDFSNLVKVAVFGVFLSFLVLLDLGDRRFALGNLLPRAYRHDASVLGQQMRAVWRGWLKATLAYIVLVTIASVIMYLLLGVPYPWLMALLTAVVIGMPAFGGVLSSLAVGLPCLFLGSSVFTHMPPWAFALLVVVLCNVVSGAVYYFVLLPLLGKSTQLPISVVLIGILASFGIGSVVLAFVLVPLIATLRILFSYILAKTRQLDPFPGETADAVLAVPSGARVTAIGQAHG
jgi:predicted PurR-regulated permease PerM